ncbi:MAG: helix-turn-helix domain-containing protein [Lachnospiraceae bacterium]|nr:helix-turn-helix domain-containing protein [Lachnospiraceae bacterium]
MITNHIIKNCIEEVNSISKVDFLVADEFGTILATTSDFSELDKNVLFSFAQSEAESQEVKDILMLKVVDDGNVTFVLAARGGEEKFIVGRIVASELRNLVVAYKDRIDKNSFYQNLLLDNLLLVDIYNRCQSLHIDAVAPRCVFAIELTENSEISGIEMVRELFSYQNGDFVTTVDENHIIVIKALDDSDTYEDLDDTARMLVDMFNSEALTNVRVSYGTIVREIKGVSKSYKEAHMALDVGKIFYPDKKIISYSSLGIGRLIYQLPVHLCQMYIDEVFGGKLPEDVDDEILNTINKFLENSLNVSETSRQLYIHRNTLVYRIEKLQKATGLDVRNFEDALTFRIAMMVLAYIDFTRV